MVYMYMHACRRASSCAQDAGCTSASPSQRALNRERVMVVARVCSKSMYESAEEICVNYYYYLLKIFKGELLYSDRVYSRTPVCARIPVLISHTQMLALPSDMLRSSDSRRRVSIA